MRSGDVLYFWAEDQKLMVVMVDKKGARVYNIECPEFTHNGCVKTRYFSYEELNEMCSHIGNVKTFESK